jgi:CRISPR system Cascade subunit CasB
MSERSPFVLRLEKLRDSEDRAALARLRRGLGQSNGCVEMYPYVVPFLPKDTRQTRWFFLVGSLFGLHPQAAPAGEETVGTLFARMRDHDRASESLEGRFVALLNAHEDDLGEHLRHAVSLARSRNIAVDFNRLLADLLRWSHPERFVQLRWGRDFWGRGPVANPAAKPDGEAVEKGTAGKPAM